MGVSRSPQELAAKLNRYAVEVGRANRTGVEAAALAVKRTTEPLVRNATGGDMRLSGVGKRGAKIGVRYTVRGTEDATAIVKATGPAQLIERDQPPHLVASKYAPRSLAKGFGRGRAGARRGLADRVGSTGAATGAGWPPRAVISFNGITVRYAIKAGGSKGRKPFKRGFAKGETLAPVEYAKAQRKAMLSVFQ